MARSRLLARKWQSWQRLDSDEQRWFIVAWIMFSPIALSLKLGNLRLTQKVLAQFTPSQQRSHDKDLAQKVARSVQLAVDRSLIVPNCLQRSLVLWFLLRRQNLDPELRIGVRNQQGEFQAHAWIEYRGQVLNDVAEVRSRYTTFKRPINAHEVKKAN